MVPFSEVCVRCFCSLKPHLNARQSIGNIATCSSCTKSIRVRPSTGNQGLVTTLLHSRARAGRHVGTFSGIHGRFLRSAKICCKSPQFCGGIGSDPPYGASESSQGTILNTTPQPPLQGPSPPVAVVP